MYNRKMRSFKPDVESYLAEKSSRSGTNSPGGTSSALIKTGASAELQTAYGQLSYGDHKPSDDDVDRLVSHLNNEQAQRSKRARNRDDDDGEVTYINEANKRFNAKAKRFYDKYTTEIRENFERGTAL